MKQIKGIKAVFFDLDGTLLNSLDDLGSACNHVLAAHNLPTHPLAAYARMVGNGFETLVSRAVPQNPPLAPDKGLLQELVAEARSYYAANMAIHSLPYPGVPAMLTELAESGLSLGVYTNKPDEMSKVLIEHYFPQIPFCHVQGARHDLPLKPDPTVLNQILASLGLEKAHCAYVGDSDVDMLTAKNCAIAGIGAAWGFRGAEELAASGATAIALNVPEVLEIISH